VSPNGPGVLVCPSCTAETDGGVDSEAADGELGTFDDVVI
jgi:hypothetical protein